MELYRIKFGGLILFVSFGLIQCCITVFVMYTPGNLNGFNNVFRLTGLITFLYLHSIYLRNGIFRRILSPIKKMGYKGINNVKYREFFCE